MSNPRGLSNSPILTEYARLLGPSLGSFIADQVFPVVDVDTKKGQFHDIADGFGAASPGHLMMMAGDQERPLSIAAIISKVSGWEVDDQGLGIKLRLSEEKFATGEGLDLRKAYTAILMRLALQIREVIAAGVAFSTTVFSGKTAALAGGDRWDTATGDPLQDVLDAQDIILQNSGERANTAVMGWQVFKALQNNSVIREYVKYTKGVVGPIPADLIASALGLEKIIVGEAVRNTAVEGQTASKGFIWGKSVLLAKLRPSPSPYTPQSCLQRWRLRGSVDGAVREYPLPGDYVHQIDQVWCDQFAAPTTELGYLYTTVVS